MNGGFPTLLTLDWWSLSGFKHNDILCFHWSIRDFEAQCGRKRLGFEPVYCSGHRPWEL